MPTHGICFHIVNHWHTENWNSEGICICIEVRHFCYYSINSKIYWLLTQHLHCTRCYKSPRVCLKHMEGCTRHYVNASPFCMRLECPYVSIIAEGPENCPWWILTDADTPVGSCAVQKLAGLAHKEKKIQGISACISKGSPVTVISASWWQGSCWSCLSKFLTFAGSLVGSCWY